MILCMALAFPSFQLIWLVLEREEEVVVVARLAQVAPHTEDGICGEDVLVRRHGEYYIAELAR